MGLGLLQLGNSLPEDQAGQGIHPARHVLGRRHHLSSHVRQGYLAVLAHLGKICV